MSNKEILEKAILKAIEGGYDMGGLLAPMDPGSYKVKAPFGGSHLIMELTNWQGESHMESVNAILFDHKFAKSLWGEELWSDQPTMHQYYDTLWDGGPDEFGFTGQMWQYHLQAMVISEDPLEYLGENI